MERPEVTEARSEYFPCTSQALKPGVPFSTRKPRIFPSSHFAQIKATAASEPLAIHIFLPFKMYIWTFCTAGVSMLPGLEPNRDSVSPKQPIALPCYNKGSQLSFCASDP